MSIAPRTAPRNGGRRPGAPPIPARQRAGGHIRPALTIAGTPSIMVTMSAGELLVQRLHVDLRRQASALCRR
ncbi:putative leader peptide [Streptomonospora alba]